MFMVCQDSCCCQGHVRQIKGMWHVLCVLKQCSKSTSKKGPQKFAIANGFVVGSFPEVFSYTDKHGNAVRTKIDIEQDVNDVLRALLAPIRPYGFVTAFYGDSHQSVHDHYQYFEMDQSHVGGVINYLDSGDSGQGVFAMICGRMTPSQT